jgi:hypothetical protein
MLAATTLDQQLELLHLAVSFVSAQDHSLNQTAEESQARWPLRLCLELQTSSMILGDEMCGCFEHQPELGVGPGAIFRRANSLEYRRMSDGWSSPDGISRASHVAPPTGVDDNRTARLPLRNSIQIRKDLPDELRGSIDPD